MLSRRDLVGKIAAGTAAVCAVGVARAGFASTRKEANASDGAGIPSLPATVVPPAEAKQSVVDSGPPETLSAPAPWDLLRPLALGSAVAHGWSVAGLTGAVDGSCVLTLRNERGREHRVHVCRNDGSPQGIVYTNRLDLIVMNGGQGDQPTDESFAQAVAEVGHVLAANERKLGSAPVVASLMPHAERVRAFSGPEDRRLR
jgi:hypothetical protein